MAANDLIFLGLTNNADGTEYLITFGLGLNTGGAPPPVIDTGSPLLKRNIDLYISKSDNAGANATNTVTLSVKDFSYNRQSSTEIVARSTLDGTEVRGVKPHISAVSPVGFTFTTYINPLLDTNVTSPEEYLWVSLMGVDTLISNSASSKIDFAEGNVEELQNLTLWFDRPNKTEGNYRLDNAVVDTAEISFDINNIAEIKWSGRALSIAEDNTPPAFTDRTSVGCLKSKLSTITMKINAVDYSAALIGGTLRINNNNTFYGRAKLGETAVPVGSYTGKRETSGNLNFYLKTGSSGNFTTTSLFKELLENIANDDYEDTHSANITITIGGATAPNVQLKIPQALLSLGQQGFAEVITLNIPFIAEEEPGRYLSVTYTA